MSMNESLFRLWDLISNGSLTIEYAEPSDVISLKISKDSLEVDIKDMEFLKKIAPFIKGFQSDFEGEVQKPQEIGLFGIADAILGKRAKMKAQLSVLRGITSVLVKHEKTVIVTRNGKPVVKLGQGASSTMLRMLNIKHVEIDDMGTAMTLMNTIQ
jgi:hypothetical protein